LNPKRYPSDRSRRSMFNKARGKGPRAWVRVYIPGLGRVI